MKKRIVVIVVTVSLLFVFLLSSGGAAWTRTSTPQAISEAEVPSELTEPPAPGAQRNADGLWQMPSGSQELEVAQPASTGGPDSFGYTWDDSIPLNWIDATSGTDTGMSGESSGQAVGPIPLPFTFKFYENSYAGVYIAASGYLGFSAESYWRSQQDLPSAVRPNNVISPWWTPIRLNSTGPAGRVYYASGGTAPNRYFVVEWHDVAGGYGGDETYRFEVILHENGNVDLQYQLMAYTSGYYCGAAGIEDSTGTDGLSYLGFCYQAPSYKAVRFFRPPPSARVRIFPNYLGKHSRANQFAEFQVPIRNTGELGVDTYDLTISSSWPVSLFADDGVTPLTDTDADGLIDTGPVVQGGAVTIVAKVQTPGNAVMGGYNWAEVTARSSLDTSRTAKVTLQTAVPAPFAQVLWDQSMSLYLAQPVGQAEKAIDNGSEYNLAVHYRTLLRKAARM